MREKQTIRVYKKGYGLVYLKEYNLKKEKKGKKPSFYVVGKSAEGICVKGTDWDECINVLSKDNTFIYENDVVEVSLSNRLITGVVVFCPGMGMYGLEAGDLILPAYLLKGQKVIGNLHESKDELYLDKISFSELRKFQGISYVVNCGEQKKESDKIKLSDIPIATFYTDGGCERNPGGPGGYGTVLVHEGKILHEISGGEKESTNNRMELAAVVAALEFMDKHDMTCAEIISDSKYVVDGKTKWLNNWIKNGWTTSSGPVKNKEQWEKIIELCENKTIRFKWVKGHDGNKFNERCDQLATIEINKVKQQ